MNVFAHNQPSGATDDVPQVKDRHRLVGVQVGANLGGEEAEALSFWRKALWELWRIYIDEPLLCARNSISICHAEVLNYLVKWL